MDLNKVRYIEAGPVKMRFHRIDKNQVLFTAVSDDASIDVSELIYRPETKEDPSAFIEATIICLTRKLLLA